MFCRLRPQVTDSLSTLIKISAYKTSSSVPKFQNQLQPSHPPPPFVNIHTFQFGETLAWTSAIRGWSPKGAIDFGLREVDVDGEYLPDDDNEADGFGGGGYSAVDTNKEFMFNGIFGPRSSQVQVFDQVGPPLIDAVMTGTQGQFPFYLG